MANELEIGSGLKLPNPAPADAYRSLPQVGAARSRGYASVADACTKVLNAVRYDGMTVYLTGLGEYWWKHPDYSDAGLVEKTSAATGGPAYDDTALTGRVSDLETDLNFAEGEINDLQNEVADQDGRLELLEQAGPGYTDAQAISAVLDSGQVALPEDVIEIAKGANLFRFETVAAMQTSQAWRLGGRKGVVWKDTEANNGDYYIAADGYAILKTTATASEVIASFELVTDATKVVAGRTYRYTIAATERLERAKLSQNPTGAPGQTVLPVASDGTGGGGTYWVEQSPSAAAGPGSSVTLTNNLATTATGTALDAAQGKVLADRLNPKLATPAYAAVMTINAGTAIGAMVGPIQATGDITSLLATLTDGAEILVLIQAVGTAVTVTLPEESSPGVPLRKIKGEQSRFFLIPLGEIRRVIFEKAGTYLSYLVI